jgi:hypothetical protein
LKAETRKEKNKFARELIKLKNGGITKWQKVSKPF